MTFQRRVEHRKTAGQMWMPAGGAGWSESPPRVPERSLVPPLSAPGREGPPWKAGLPDGVGAGPDLPPARQAEMPGRIVAVAGMAHDGLENLPRKVTEDLGQDPGASVRGQADARVEGWKMGDLKEGKSPQTGLRESRHDCGPVPMTGAGRRGLPPGFSLQGAGKWNGALA